ncbi:aldehyde dehydrogenase iron-sulfur subunit PaoA [Algoriphagus sp.]|uniref:aldehyde dehydrogenase iron-sulfur subunit PaoA n=1 Tax=Algoriphagus sp. TaxID=1872435 RepID=UPI003F70CF3F
MEDAKNWNITRREMIKGTAATVALTLSSNVIQTAMGGSTNNSLDGLDIRETVLSEVSVLVNGVPYKLNIDTRTSLLDLLREHLHLTGTKKGCDHGQCGACTVLVEGKRINSCLSLAVMHQRENITTIEGLGTPGNLHKMQSSFIRHDGYQCGYCTPGQICSAVAVLDEIKAGIPSHVTEDLTSHPEISNLELRERMSGNICRCGAYSNIAEAIAEVAES